MTESFWIDYANLRYVGKTPDTCPLCHVKAHIGSGLVHTISNDIAQYVFKCPSCDDFFIGYYIFDVEDQPDRLHALGTLKLVDLKPSRPKQEDISDTVLEISPEFVTIYSQANEAKTLGLEQIAGPGYRKAFEFLMKDYAKLSVNTDEEKAEIEKIFVGSVVKKYVNDPRVQQLASRALWLGNDESHYLRKWVDHDIDDLITLIKLTLHWIEMEQLSKKYQTDMTSGPEHP